MVITRRKPGTEPGLQVFWIFSVVKNRLEKGGFSVLAVIFCCLLSRRKPEAILSLHPQKFGCRSKEWFPETDLHLRPEQALKRSSLL